MNSILNHSNISRMENLLMFLKSVQEVHISCFLIIFYSHFPWNAFKKKRGVNFIAETFLNWNYYSNLLFLIFDSLNYKLCNSFIFLNVFLILMLFANWVSTSCDIIKICDHTINMTKYFLSLVITTILIKMCQSHQLSYAKRKMMISKFVNIY